MGAQATGGSRHRSCARRMAGRCAPVRQACQCRAHQQHEHDAHEDALQVAQALHTLQQRRGAPEERVLPRLLDCARAPPGRASARPPCTIT